VERFKQQGVLFKFVPVEEEEEKLVLLQLSQSLLDLYMYSLAPSIALPDAPQLLWDF
jgi:hypothetical protein